MNNNKKGSILFILVMFLIVAITIFFFPKINEYIIKINSPKIEKVDDEPKKEKVFNKEIIEDIVFPIMRSNIYSTSTYYSLDKFTIGDMKNSDMLLNAFLDIHEGNIVSTNSLAACGGNSAEFNQKYMILRIRNILGRDINYKLENFEVPSGSDSKYVGSWTYDSANKKFIYKGECNNNKSKTKYYDLKQLKEGKYDGNDLILYYYMGFAKVEGNKFTIYSDTDMKKSMFAGDFVDFDSMQEAFEAYANKNKKVYKYIFKNTLCTYSTYCLYEGSWD